MGNLTNQYVSQSYQGLLKLDNSNTGVTATLQYVQDGLGNNIPMQVSTSSVVITGSLIGSASYAIQALSASYAPDTTNTGSLVSTSSFNAYTSSNDSKVNSLIAATGSFVTETESGSFMITGSVAGDTLTFTKGNGSQFSLQVNTGSLPAGVVSGSQQIIDLGFATTSSLTSLSASIATTDLGQNNRLGSLETATGSLQNQINQKLDTGSFNTYTSSNDGKVNSLINATGSYATTSSLSSLSQSIASTDLAQDNRLTSIEGVTGSFASTSSLNSYTLTSSFNTYTSSNDGKVNALINATGSYATTGSNVFQGTQTITGSLGVTGTITALSASITYLETIYQTSSVLFSSGSNILGDASNDTQTLFGTVVLPNGPLVITGSVTASAGFNGNLTGTASYATNALSASHAVNADTAISSSQAANAVSSSYANNATSASYSNNSTSASFAQASISSSFAQNAVSASHSVNSDTAISASQAQNAVSSSHSVNSDTSISSSFAQNATSASFAQTSISSSFSNFAVSSSQAQDAVTASYALNANSSSYAENAGTASFAQDIFVVGKNTTGVQIDKGTVVRIAGSTGDQALIVTASWEDDNNSANTLGILSQNIANDASGSVITTGTLIGINTSGFTAGDILYLSSSGQYTNVIPPAPYHEVRLGQVLRVQQNVGSMYVQIQNGYELSELHDVDITSPVVGDLLVYRSGSYGQWVNETGGELGFATTSSVNEKLDTGSFNTYTASIDARTGSYITTGSISSTQSITGSLIISGSESITGSFGVRNGDLNVISNNTTINTSLYLTSSLAGQSNVILGWGEVLAAGGPGANQANYTGSLRITGSNNIIAMPQIRATALGGGTDQQGYISGSSNIMLSNNAGIFLNTGSLLFPRTQANIIGDGSSMRLNFTTSSLAGGHPLITNNFVMGATIIINSNSGSYQTISNNAILGGSLTSTQNFVTNTRPNFIGNNVIGGVTLNHISSSTTYSQNYNNSNITVNNHLSSSNIANNRVEIIGNSFLGGSSNTGHNIWVSGSQSSNVTRNIIDNIIGGKNIIVSSSFVSSSASSLVSSLIYGQNLIVSGNHAATVGGSTFLGRYNDATSLHLAQDVVFAVGTGTGTSTRRTGLYITSGSLVGVSGSLDVKGNTDVTGSVNISNVMKLALQDPLPAGVSGQLAVSSSNELYFNNGTSWNLIS